MYGFNLISLLDVYAAFGGIVAFYSIIHLPSAELVPAFREWWRVLRPDGLALIAFHIGDTVVHLDEWWGRAVDIEFRFLELEAVAAALVQAGFTIEATLRRAVCRCRASQRARLHACTAGSLKIACYVLKFPSTLGPK